MLAVGSMVGRIEETRVGKREYDGHAPFEDITRYEVPVLNADLCSPTFPLPNCDLANRLSNFVCS